MLRVAVGAVLGHADAVAVAGALDDELVGGEGRGGGGEGRNGRDGDREESHQKHLNTVVGNSARPG